HPVDADRPEHADPRAAVPGRRRLRGSRPARTGRAPGAGDAGRHRDRAQDHAADAPAALPEAARRPRAGLGAGADPSLVAALTVPVTTEHAGGRRFPEHCANPCALSWTLALCLRML